MPDVSFTNLVIVAAVAFMVPLLLGFAPGLRLPAVVLEIVAGIALGPSGLGVIEADVTLEILALVGLAFLLLLAGTEVDVDQLRGKVGRLAGLGFLLSLLLAIAAGLLLAAVGLVDAPLFVAVVLIATSLGVVVPVLKDAGQVESGLGQLVVAGASIADFGAILLLALFFAREETSAGTRLVLLGGFALAAVVTALSIFELERWGRLSAVLRRLQDTTAQIRVRGAFLLMAVFVVLAERFGVETILGAFMAGAILRTIDRDQMMTHPLFRAKLEAVGYGVFIPVYFVTSGVRFDLGALFSDSSALGLVPVFLAAIVVVRGLPALLYRRVAGRQGTLAAGLLQATTLPFIVAATQIGQELGTIDASTAAAMVAAGLTTLVAFPIAALAALRPARDAADGSLAPSVSAELAAAPMLPDSARDGIR